MGVILNPIFSRLGRYNFWEFQLCGWSFVSFLKKFFSIYLLLKAVLGTYDIFIVSLKIVIFKTESFYILINFLKTKSLAYEFESGTNRYLSGRSYSVALRKKTFKRGIKSIRVLRKGLSKFSAFVNAPAIVDRRKPVDKQLVVERLARVVKKNLKRATEKKEKLRGVWIPVWKRKQMLNRRHTVGRRLRFNMLILDLQQLVFSKLFIGCQLQFRSVFRNSILKSLVRKVSTEVRQEIGWHLRQYNYLKDILRVTGVALFFQSSELLASFVSILVHRHRNLLKHLGNLRQLISGYLLTDFKDLVSLKIGVFGKIMGEQSRRFRRYLIFYGAMLKERTVNHSLNYTIVKTYNVYGGFCIRVWLFVMDLSRLC